MACYKRIRELREDNDLTQRQLASILDMPQPQYFRYEQGYSNRYSHSAGTALPYFYGLYPWTDRLCCAIPDEMMQMSILSGT